MMFNFSLSRFGFGQFTKPVFLFTLIVLTISTVFTTFILTGSTAPGLRKFYLISLRYNPDASASKILGSLDDLLSSDKGKVSFSNIRVGYRGLCIEHSNGWDCAKDGTTLGHIAGDISGDPLDLVSIADIYRNKISFSFPIWVAVIALSIGWLGVALNCIPGIPIPAWTKKVAAAGCTLGSLALLGAMTLQQVTSGAVSTLVDKMGMDAVEIHIGTANIGFGWAAFALSMLATIGVTAIVAAEWGVAAAQAKALEKTTEVMERATGGRFSTVDFNSDVESQPVKKPEATRASLGTSSMRNAVVGKGIEYGGNMLKSSLRKK